MIQQKDYLSALYFLEILPETRESQLMKFKCLITGYEHRALEFAQELKTTYTGKPEYEEVLKYIADAISELQPEYDQLLKTAIDNYRELLNEYNHGETFRSWKILATSTGYTPRVRRKKPATTLNPLFAWQKSKTRLPSSSKD